MDRAIAAGQRVESKSATGIRLPICRLYKKGCGELGQRAHLRLHGSLFPRNDYYKKTFAQSYFQSTSLNDRGSELVAP
jgi:hypothetical protein